MPRSTTPILEKLDAYPKTMREKRLPFGESNQLLRARTSCAPPIAFSDVFQRSQTRGFAHRYETALNSLPANLVDLLSPSADLCMFFTIVR